MAYFSDGSEGRMFQERQCFQCKYWIWDIDQIGSDLGCPIWLLHELHVGDKAWQPALDLMIPMEPKVFDGIRHTFAGQCATFWPKKA